MSRSGDTGLLGEQLAAAYLERRGMRLAERRYRCRFGEIDLVAWDGDTLCFVEVKTRTSCTVGLPREYVTVKKQEKLRSAALLYLSERGLDCPARFDVAEVYLKNHGEARIDYIENAF